MDLALAQIEKGLLPSIAARDAEHTSECSDKATPALVPQAQRSSGTCLETGNYTTGGGGLGMVGRKSVGFAKEMVPASCL